MDIFLKTANAIFPAFSLIALGWFLRRVGLLTDELVSGLNKLSFMVVFPVMLFQKIGAEPFSAVFNGPLLIGCLLCYTVTWFITFFSVKYAVKVKAGRAGVIVQGAFRSNTAMLGLAVLAGAYGDAVFGPGGILLAAIVPFMNVMSILALLLPHHKIEGAKSLRLLALALITNPLVIGAVLGAVRSAAAIKMPEAIDGGLEMLSAMAIPVSLIGAGGSLCLEKLKGDFKASFVTSLIKLVFLPAITWIALAKIFDIHGMDLSIGVMYAAAPTAVSSFIMAEQMKGDRDLAASILAMTHVFAIVSMGVWLAALFKWS